MTLLQFLNSTIFTQERDKATKTTETHHNTDYHQHSGIVIAKVGGEARFPPGFGKASASSARPCSTLPAPGGTACGPALSAVPSAAPARDCLATRGARRHGERPPPPAGERAASGAGVRPRGALPGAGRAAQPGGAGGRQPGGGHVSGGGVEGPVGQVPAWRFSSTLCAVEGTRVKASRSPGRRWQGSL